MNFAKIHSRTRVGVEAFEVKVEVYLVGGFPGFSIVGLPEKSVKESKDRVHSALLSSRFEFPVRRIIVNLAPADVPKEGSGFDLAIALGILLASKQLKATDIDQYEFVAELGLSGELRGINGILPMAVAVNHSNRFLVGSSENKEETSLVKDLKYFVARNLLEVCAHLEGFNPLSHYEPQIEIYSSECDLDLSEIKGQSHAKRALEVAASGGHSLLMVGPPGAGKTMLASRLPGILPSMTEAEALSAALVYSVKQGFDRKKWRRRPFRAPHHTSSGIALVGGGRVPQPGEISLAHNGVLFLDELPEFKRHVLENLREPLESGVVRVSRAAYQIEFPAQFQLIAAMNPCPCGYLGDIQHQCRCTPDQILRYQSKISGPLLDRIDISIELPALQPQLLMSTEKSGENNQSVRARVEAARQRQLDRSKKMNALLSTPEINQYCSLKESDQKLLEESMIKLKLSARSYHRILKLARTVADLANRDQIEKIDLLEALSYRRLWRER